MCAWIACLCYQLCCLQEAVKRPPSHELPFALRSQAGQVRQDRFSAVVIEQALSHQRQRVLHFTQTAFAVHGKPSEPHGPVTGGAHPIRYHLVLDAPGDLRGRAGGRGHLPACRRRCRRPVARTNELAALRRERMLSISRTDTWKHCRGPMRTRP